MPPSDQLVVTGAREHNLKNIDRRDPARRAGRHHRAVAARASRRSRSTRSTPRGSAATSSRCRAYARQFLGQMDKPDVDSIEGLSPAISIEQKTTLAQPALDGRHGHRDLRLPAPALRARRPAALPQLRQADRRRRSAEQIVDQVLELPEGTRFMVLAPIVRGRKGEYGRAARGAARRGLRARRRSTASCAGSTRRSGSTRRTRHDIEVVVDRLVMKPELRKRARRLGRDGASRWPTGSSRSSWSTSERASAPFSEKFACLDCGISLPELAPRMFSFNTPARRVPALRRPRRAAGDRPRADRARRRRCRSARARSRRGRRARRNYFEQLTAVDRRALRASTSTRRGRSCRAEQREILLYGTNGDRVHVSRTSNRFGRRRVVHDRASRGSSRTSSGATARPTPTGRARESRSTCRSCRAPTARARGCGRRRAPCRSAAWRSTSSRALPARRGAGVDPRARADRAASGRSRGGSCARSPSGSPSWSTSASTT